MTTRVECLPFATVPHTSKLFLDFLAESPAARRYYPHSPFARTWADRPLSYPTDRRAAVAGVLARQNRIWGAGPEALANIERFRSGANVIVTGQQVALFGGQMLAVLKALTAVKLAEETNSVPIFWLASEDHDLQEVTGVNFLRAGGALHELRLPVTSSGEAVGGIPLPSAVSSLVQEVEELIGPSSPLAEWLRESYQVGTTLADAYARLFARVFREQGLVIIDNRDRELHRLAAPVYARAARESHGLNQALIARVNELEADGYHAQVKVTSASTLLFAELEGKRLPIKHADGGYAIAEQRLSPQELEQQITAAPERFSANALLRPVVQDHLLPTLAYVGGPAEVAYFAQNEVVYQRLQGSVTPIVPRISATILDRRASGLLERYGQKFTDALVPLAELEAKLAAQMVPSTVKDSLRAAEQTISATLGRLGTDLRGLDPTLQAAVQTGLSKVRYQFAKLNRKAGSAAQRRHEDVRRHAEHLANFIYPAGRLQEREVAAVALLAWCGPDALPQLAATLQTACRGHQVVFWEGV